MERPEMASTDGKPEIVSTAESEDPSGSFHVRRQTMNVVAV
jgi:hypothetical protein